MKWASICVDLAKLVLLAATAACSKAPSRPDTGATPGVSVAHAASEEPASPSTPATRSYPPSELQITGSRQALHRNAGCAECHPTIAAEWAESAHAYSSFSNPIYVASVERLREEVGLQESRLCAGCHDPALLVGTGMSEAIDPEEARAHAGVSCLTCHAVEQVKHVGNASYLLRAKPPLRPTLGDARSIAAHRRAMGEPLLPSADFCVGCHRGFLDQRVGNATYLPGVDDVTPWQRSAYGGSHVARVDEGPALQTCQSCHMPQRRATSGVQKGKRVASHRFAGGHTWLASMLGSEEQARAAREQLQRSLLLDVALVEADGHAWLAPGTRAVPLGPRHGERAATESPAKAPRGVSGGESESGSGSESGMGVRSGGAADMPQRLVFHVAIENTGVGHHFPGGTRDLSDVWLDVRLEDARGRLLASSERSERFPDPGVHSLLALPGDERAQPIFQHRTHDFRATLVDTTIEPRAVQLVRYSVSPAELLQDATALPSLPWRLSVVARHRSRNPVMQEAACKLSRSPQGQALALGARRHKGKSLDPCGEQPTTELYRVELELAPPDALSLGPSHSLGEEAETPLSKPRLQRLHRYLRGLERELPEKMDLGLRKLGASVQQALGGSLLTPRERADWALSLAKLHAAQGRTDAALQLLSQARTWIGPHPALSSAAGSALSSVWRFEEATEPYRAAAQAAPRDDRLWQGLAHALHSTGRFERARQAAEQGLLNEPRSEGLLLALAKSRQALDGAASKDSRGAFLAHRAPDQATQLATQCRRENELCRAEYLPVHEHELVPATASDETHDSRKNPPAPTSR